MKITKILLETVLPIVIGTSILIGYIFVTNNSIDNTELESCEKYQISKIAYLTYFMAIVVLSSLYQITIGKKIIGRIENNFGLNILNCVVFSMTFSVILIFINIFQKQKKIEWEFFFMIFITLFFIGLLFMTLTKLWRKILKLKLH